MLLGGACVLFGGGMLLFRQFSTVQKREVKRKQRSRAIAEAEEQPELMPAIDPADVESAEAAGTVKVHVELPTGDIVSFRVKRRRLGASFDELCAVIVQGVPGKEFTIAQLSGMEMQYEDKDGDMLVLTSSSDVAELVNEAQAIFVSKRTKKAGTRIAQGPRALTAGPAATNSCAVSLPASPAGGQSEHESLSLIPL